MRLFAALALSLVAAPAWAQTLPPPELLGLLGDLLAPETTVELDAPVFGPPALGGMPLEFGQTDLAAIAGETGTTIHAVRDPLPLSWICLLPAGADGTRLLLAAEPGAADALPLSAIWYGPASSGEPDADSKTCTMTPLALSTGLPILGSAPAELAAQFGLPDLPGGTTVNLVNETPIGDPPTGALFQHLQVTFADGRVSAIGMSQLPL